jgi:ribosomal protein S6--L-glutamate ligase
MILSYHPCYVGDENRLCAGRDPDAADIAAIKAARAVILPQGCFKPLFEMATENCSHVFPDYALRFRLPGKIGQAALFRSHGVPHPETRCYESLDVFDNLEPRFGYPLVFKFTWSGEGENVWLVNDYTELQGLLTKAAVFEKSGQAGFLLQQYVETKGRSLRVVIINGTCVSYWRIQPEPGRFGTQCAHGAFIDHHADPSLQETARTAVTAFCRKTGINLAGFDILFNTHDPVQKPLFLEINYFFGRRGLGGSEAYYKLLCREIDKWIATL